MSKKYKKLIILEDDCIPREEFFTFMHKAFVVYKKKKNIMRPENIGSKCSRLLKINQK